MRLIDYFRILKALIILFLLFACMSFVSNQNGKVLEETLAGSNSDAVNTTLWHLRYLKNDVPSFCKFFKNLSQFLCYFATYNKDYYEWLCNLRWHIQVGKLPAQGTWLGLVTQSVIWGSMWPAGQTSKNSVINIRCWRCFPLSGPICPCYIQHRWLKTHFVLLAKITEHAVLQVSPSHWFVFIENL